MKKLKYVILPIAMLAIPWIHKFYVTNMMNAFPSIGESGAHFGVLMMTVIVGGFGSLALSEWT